MLPETKQRLLSLDVFRGATIASMILVNNPGTWRDIYAPLEHATWHGWTPTDMVFPFFLWIAGVAMTLSFAKRVERGDNRAHLLLHAVKRGAIIVFIGLAMAAIPRFPWATLRFPGVLQRIGICYAIAAAIFLYTKVRGQVIWIVGLLTVYWMLMTLVPAPGFAAGDLSKEGNFAHYVDGLVLTGHMWGTTKTWDPEGIVSTIPAIATCLFGILVGHVLRVQRSIAEKAAWLFVGGNLLIFIGLVMSFWMPINKSLWTSSFAVFMAGMATNIFALLYWVVDGVGIQRWSKPFQIYGMNAIAMFVLSGMFAKTLGIMKWQRPIYQTVFVPLASPLNASLLYAIANVLLFYCIAWLMYRKGWFVRF